MKNRSTVCKVNYHDLEQLARLYLSQPSGHDLVHVGSDDYVTCYCERNWLLSEKGALEAIDVSESMFWAAYLSISCFAI